MNDPGPEPELDLCRRDVVESLLRRHRLRPDKRLGQNFLIDRSARERILAASDLEAGDTVLEIGAGLGTLSQALAGRVRRLIAVEYDRRLEPALRETVGHLPGVEIVIDDVLRLDLPRLVGDETYRVVANIPYQITSHLIRRLLESEAPPQRVVLTVQREVAERIMAGPGAMNLLALGVQAYGAPRVVGHISASSFLPQPGVESAVVRIDVHRPPRLSSRQAQAVFRLARAGFSQPRKKLRNAIGAGLRLTPASVEASLRRLGVSPDLRAEDLSLDDWTKMAEGWEASAPGAGAG